MIENILANNALQWCKDACKLDIETYIDGGDNMGLPAMSMVLHGGDKDDDSGGDGGDDDNDGKLCTCKRDMEAPVTE